MVLVVGHVAFVSCVAPRVERRRDKIKRQLVVVAHDDMNMDLWRYATCYCAISKETVDIEKRSRCATSQLEVLKESGAFRG